MATAQNFNDEEEIINKMRVQVLLMCLLCMTVMSSCKTYLDVTGKSVTTNYMTLKYNNDYNELEYFSKVNGTADNEVFYKTHFSINLPKRIINWMILGNKFYYEYDSKQVIYIYPPYKNEGLESDEWKLKNTDENSDWSYLEEYWHKRSYNEKYTYAKKPKRITKLYTNGKYEILLYNIKEKNYGYFLENIKSFHVK